jgi:hypothetical protein
MSTISEAVRARVRQRADNRCEYCLSPQALVMGRLQIDHVLPLAKGGSNAEDNLCLACELCNQYKWTKTEASDPQTGETVPLFNPRNQAWHEHFVWSEDGVEVFGKSDCGRATIVALRLNNPLAKAVRRNWVKAGWHPPRKGSESV